MTTTIAPILKSVVVPVPPARAFAHFTEGLGRWWPLATHSIFGEQAETAVMEGRVGGRVYERAADGRVGEWGEVLAWEPPRRVVFSFMKYHAGVALTEVEVAFTAVAGGTRVDLEHRGWEAAPDQRHGYDEGWDVVFGQCFAGSDWS